MDNSQIIEKVQKILALAERAGTEQEAETAMAQAHKMLARYNISMAQVRIAGEKPKAEGISESNVNAATGMPYERKIWISVARLYFCDLAYSSIEYTLYGTQTNIKIAQFVAESVCRTCKKLSNRARPSQGCTTRQARNSFRNGFAERINHRVIEIINAANNEKPSDSRALVVADVYKQETQRIQEYFEQGGLKFRTARRTQTINNDRGAYMAGADAAKEVSLRANGIGERNEGKTNYIQ